MYKALYSFESQDPSSLSFTANDCFTVLESKDQYWWLVQNGSGEVGYVPANYVAKDEAAHDEVLKSIDRAIDAIHQEAAATVTGKYTTQQQNNLIKLQQHRQNVDEEQHRGHNVSVSNSCQPFHHVHPHDRSGQKRQSQKKMLAPPSPKVAPVTPTRNACNDLNSTKSASAASNHSPISSNTQKKEFTSAAANDNRTPPPKDTKVLAPLSVVHKVGSPMLQRARDSPPRGTSPIFKHFPLDCSVPVGLGAELVERVRTSTGLSFELSHVAVAVVVSHMKDALPPVGEVMNQVLSTLSRKKPPLDNEELLSQDAVRLHTLLEELSAAKDDSQQRSWFLHEDEHVITQHLEELLSILNSADPDVCRQVVAADHYSGLQNLALYYQMEARVSLRLLLLQCFGALCGLHGRIISELLNSVLPLELARDIQTDNQDIQKLCYSILVLTMLFSLGEELPIRYYDNLNIRFIQYVLDNIESPPNCDVDDQLPDLLVHLLLAFNLHLQMPSSNIVMKVLADRGTAKTFTEKLMLLINRGDDPVRMFEHEHQPPDSLLKFVSDMYSTPSTSTLLYTNDEKVLIDIILRQLTDLCSADKIRTEYLSLIHLVLRNSMYADHQHRRSELQNCFASIYREEDNDGSMDKHVVQQIYNEFSNIFTFDA